jgi:REP element-mobilizing transposase RayT
MPVPLAYHLTWTCYGQWLHGDARGYVDAHHRTLGEPYVHGGGRLYNVSFNRMAESPCWLGEEERRAVTAALHAACRFRGWSLLAVNVQPDHVHVAVEAPGITGKRAMALLKGRATRLLRQGGARERWWTEGGKVELVRDAAHLATVVAYVNRQPFARIDA